MRSFRWKVAKAISKLGVAMKKMSIASKDKYELLIIRDDEKTITFIFADNAVELHALLPNNNYDIDRLNAEYENLVFDIMHGHLRIRQKLPCDLKMVVEAYRNLVSLANEL